jgi:hypothetical protein
VKVLLDECVDRRLARDIAGHEVRTEPETGWAGLKNGELLKRAQEQFDVFVTVDRNLPFQRDLSVFSIAVVVLRAQTNRLGICACWSRSCLLSYRPRRPAKSRGLKAHRHDAEQAVAADRHTASRRRRERSISLCARVALSTAACGR